jgi:hypothetical protein
MSSVNQSTDLSIANFINIFEAASNEYKKLTKHDLHTHTFAAALDNCDSPEAVLNVFRRQAHVFDKFCKGDDRLMKWLNPTVHILFTFSATLGEGMALVSRVYTSTHSLSLCTNMFVSAISAREDNIYWYRCSPVGTSLSNFLDGLS